MEKKFHLKYYNLLYVFTTGFDLNHHYYVIVPYRRTIKFNKKKIRNT